MSNPELTVHLSVARVDSGGNTAGGEYFYSFKPDIVNVTKPGTKIIYALRDDVPDHFTLRDIFTTDAKYQLIDTKLPKDGRSISIVDLNTQRQLILVSLLVHDSLHDRLVNCDPQVINTPQAGD